MGSSSALLKLGGGYFHIEANSTMAQFTDSDITDGKTNRKGWVLYAAKQVAPGTELRLTYFDQNPIQTSGGATGPFERSLSQSNRSRLQADIQFNF